MPEATPLRVVLVDDEAPARELLREYLAAHDDVAVVGECARGLEALAALPRLAPDLVFLDIQMPGLTGFEVLERLPDPPHVVFATAYDAFALRAFEAGAVDYLLKPFDRARFDQALARAAEQIRLRQSQANQLQAVREAVTAQPLRRLFVRAGERILPVDIGEVVCAEAAGDYTRLHTPERSYTCALGLGDLEARLPPERFARVHRSYVVALDAIAHLTSDGSGGYVATLAGGREVRVSRTYAPAIRDRIW